jgi:Ca2+/Na+ antiporter
MIWDESFGYSYASWSGFFALLGAFFMLIYLWHLLVALFEDRSHEKRMGTYKGDLIKSFVTSILFWLFLWLPLIGFVWLLAKLGI